jgi:hypothetical protein
VKRYSLVVEASAFADMDEAVAFIAARIQAPQAGGWQALSGRFAH